MSTTDEEIPSIEEGMTARAEGVVFPVVAAGLTDAEKSEWLMHERFATETRANALTAALEAAEGEVRRLREALAKVADIREANGVQSEAARAAQRAISV